MRIGGLTQRDDAQDAPGQTTGEGLLAYHSMGLHAQVKFLSAPVALWCRRSSQL